MTNGMNMTTHDCIPIPKPLNTPLWWTGDGYVEEHITCPECAGTCAIEMIKGNGERVTLACGHCQSGWEPPRGWVKRTRFHYAPEQVIASKVEMHGDTFYYSLEGLSTTDSDRLFLTREECAAECDKLNRERTEQERQQEIASIASKRHSLAFSASYWGRQVKDLERKLEVAKARLSVCKKPKENAA